MVSARSFLITLVLEGFILDYNFEHVLCWQMIDCTWLLDPWLPYYFTDDWEHMLKDNGDLHRLVLVQ